MQSQAAGRPCTGLQVMYFASLKHSCGGGSVFAKHGTMRTNRSHISSNKFALESGYD